MVVTECRFDEKRVVNSGGGDSGSGVSGYQISPGGYMVFVARRPRLGLGRWVGGGERAT
jgi:hypothetical protein